MDNRTDRQIGSILDAQKRFFLEGGTLCLKSRQETLRRLESVIAKRRDDIIAALASDLGKPDVESFLTEHHFLLQEVRLVRKRLKKWLKPRRVLSPFYFQPCLTRWQYEPFGAALVMAPWNYPFQLSLSPLIAAIAAGNTVVLKPSEVTSSCEKLLVEIVRESFRQERACVVTGDATVARNLLGHSFDCIFFTGSTEIGRLVAKQAAETLTPLVLELGGKCPCVVHHTADIKMSARRILNGKLLNGGQTCFAPDFVVVHESIKAKLVKEFERLLKAIPWNAEMARMPNRSHYERLQSLLVGKEIIVGKDEPASLRMAPRILPNSSWDEPAMQDEIFGPILPVLGYENCEELASRLEKLSSPLALYLFSRDSKFTNWLMNRFRSGGVCINDTMKQATQLKAPFGGVGDSGFGRYRGRAGIEAFSYQRVVVNRASWAPDSFDLAPPYGDKLKWLKRFMR